MKRYTTYKLVKPADLNHHGSLFAGRASELFVEAGLVAAAAALGTPEHFVCLQIQRFTFYRPVPPGELLALSSRVVHTGRSSLTVLVSFGALCPSDGGCYADGLITFVHVDDNGAPCAHGLTLDEPEDEQETRERAQAADTLRRARGGK